MNNLEFESNGSALLRSGERHLIDSAVIVLNGHTYHLVVDITPIANEVCKRCALKNLCVKGSSEDILQRLCKECTPQGAGYWVENRYPMQYTLERICENQLPLYKSVSYPCRDFDRPIFISFDDKY